MRAITVLAVLAFLSGSCAALAQPWAEYAPAGGGYSVQMPGTPAVSTREEPTEAGTIPMTSAVLERGNEAYIVTYSDLPVARIDGLGAERILDNYRGGVVKGRTLRSERRILVSGYPARSMILDDEQGRVIVVTAALARYRLFQAIHVGPTGAGPGAEPGLDGILFLESLAIAKR